MILFVRSSLAYYDGNLVTFRNVTISICIRSKNVLIQKLKNKSPLPQGMSTLFASTLGHHGMQWSTEGLHTFPFNIYDICELQILANL